MLSPVIPSDLSGALPRLAPPALPQLTFYTRVGCTLCTQAEAALRDRGFCLERVDIAGNDALIAQHGHHVPVLTLLVDGGEWTVHRGPLPPAQLPGLRLRLRRLLQRAEAGNLHQ